MTATCSKDPAGDAARGGHAGRFGSPVGDRHPQGGVISPVLANVYLHRLDRDWQTRGVGVLACYADDLVVMCRTEQEADNALAPLRTILDELGLEPKGRQDPHRAP